MNVPQAAAEYFSEYGAIIFGLLVGTIAHFGRLLSSDETPSGRHVLGFLMQLGVIGLLASVATRKLGIDSEDMRALATAILAISAQEVVQYLKRSGWGPFARAAIPSTPAGEARQAEQVSRAARSLEANDALDPERLQDRVEKKKL